MSEATRSKRRRVSGSEEDVKPDIEAARTRSNATSNNDNDSRARGGWDWQIDTLNLKGMSNAELTIYGALMLVHKRLEHAVSLANRCPTTQLLARVLTAPPLPFLCQGIYIKPLFRDAAALTLDPEYNFKQWSIQMAGPKNVCVRLLYARNHRAKSRAL